MTVEFIAVVGSFQLMMVDGRPVCLVEQGKETRAGVGTWIGYRLSSVSRQYPGATITIDSDCQLDYSKDVGDRASLLQFAEMIVAELDA